MNNRYDQGVSVTELMTIVALMGLLIVAVSIFFGRGININREQYEQVLTTEDARFQIERIADSIRNAHSKNDESVVWLMGAQDYSIQVRTNIDDDDAIEHVQYHLDGTNLRRRVLEEGVGAPVERIVARSIRNSEQSQPLFVYYDSGGNTIPADQASHTNVQRVGINLLVDVNTAQEPGVAEVSTVVVPRFNIIRDVAVARLYEVAIDYPSDPLSTKNAHVTITDNNGTVVSNEVVSIIDLNDGRLVTLDGGYYINLNYQAGDIEEFLEGWYAWVGPILVGKSGDQEYYETEQLTPAELCTGNDFETLSSTCAPRTVNRGSLSVEYRPILMYTSEDGTVDYVRNITFNYAP